MKRKLLSISILAISLCLLCYGTIAYFTHEDTATNVITSGNLKIELHEMATVQGSDELVEFQDVVGIMPGDSVSKIVTVENVGDYAAYVRIAVDKSIEGPNAASASEDYRHIQLDFDTVNWEERDGYYYYKVALQPGETTKPLFRNVTFSSQLGNSLNSGKAKITVKAQATQVKNNGASVFETAGWPAN